MKMTKTIGKIGGMTVALALSLVAQQPDNTKVNQRDQKSGALTADQQGNSKADVERTANVRKAILEHKGMSTYANNVKIITQDGHVTLRGPVRDQAERDVIAGLASGIAGKTNVKNELEIAPKN